MEGTTPGFYPEPTFSANVIPQVYGGAFAPPPPSNVAPEVQRFFQAVDRDHSGKITWQELQPSLVNGVGEKFSETACKLMISMFDQDKDGTIGINEFAHLYSYINQWLGVFKNYDRDRSGNIEEQELSQAFQQMGFRFSPDFIKFLIFRADPKQHSKMTVDQFIVICIQVQRFTEAFRTRDVNQRGVISIPFEEFLNVALSCSI